MNEEKSIPPRKKPDLKNKVNYVEFEFTVNYRIKSGLSPKEAENLVSLFEGSSSKKDPYSWRRLKGFHKQNKAQEFVSAQLKKADMGHSGFMKSFEYQIVDKDGKELT
jgi:hypothetical protein